MIKRNWLIYTAMIGVFFLYTSHSGGPLAGKTGAPGENLCSQCHSGGNPQGLNGTVSIGGVPSTIIGGNTYTISVLVTNPNGLSQGGGFQMTALDDSNMKAGDFSSPSIGSQLKTGMGRQYHNHTSRRAFMMGQATWSVQWTAPVSVVNKDITFYAAGNITDMQPGFNTANDLIVTGTAFGTLQGMGAPLTVDIVQSQDVNCFGGDDGFARAMAAGGGGGYTYSWSSGSMSETANNLTAATYTVSVTDINNDMATNQVVISQPSLPTSISVLSKQDITCFNGSDGSIEVSATGNNGGFTYRWSNGQSGSFIRNVKAGLYTVTAEDLKGCTEELDVELLEGDEIETQIITADAKCSDDSTGFAMLTASGGNGPFKFDWSNGFTNEGSTSELSTLPPGKYDVRVTDSKNCFRSFSFEIMQEDGIEVSLNSKNDVSCFNGKDGSIDINITGGTVPFHIAWSNDSTTEDISGLGGGIYQVEVVDSLGCRDSLMIEIKQPDDIELNLLLSPLANCEGDSASISYTFIGGNWGSNLPDTITKRIIGPVYHISVVDSSGCQFSDSVSIEVLDTIPPEITCIEDSTTVSCNFSYPEPIVSDNCDSVSWSVVEGLGPNEIFPSGTTKVKLIAVDQAGNQAECSFTITVMNDLGLEAILTDSAICHGDSSCYILLGSGGNGPLSFILHSDTIPLVDSIAIKVDTNTQIVLWDTSGCFAQLEIGYHLPEILIDSVDITPSTSQGSKNGKISIFPSGGIGSFTFSWKDTSGAIVSTESIADSLAPGEYCCVIMDSLGCEVISPNYIIDFSTSEDVLYSGKVSLYPNPFNGSLYIKNDNINITRMRAIDTYGHQFQIHLNPRLNLEEISTDNWKPGVYRIRIETEVGTMFKRVIKR